jgi:hypothetical protein
MTRGIHTQPNNGLSNDWLTPPAIVRACGYFALDPCAHPNQFYKTARRMIAPPKDGLAEKWKGRVWLNPPYGGQLRHWIQRLADHGNGIALVPARTEVESWFWPFVWDRAHAVLFLRGRLYFHRPDGSTAGNAGHGSVLVAYGWDNAKRLERTKLVGKYIALTD